MGRLRTRVHVTDEQGRAHVFGPGSDVPDWAAAKITNPKAWEGGKAPQGQVVEPPKEAGPVEPPPTHGSGSSREAWATYVAEHRKDITVTEDMTRNDIIAAVTQEKAD